MACVELAIKRFSLIALSYQMLFNTISRNYVVYGLTTHHNRSYFNTYYLDEILSNKHNETSEPDIYQDRIVRLPDLLIFFLLVYGQTLRIILTR